MKTRNARYDIYLEIRDNGAFLIQYEDGQQVYIAASAGDTKENVLAKLQAGGYTPTGTVTMNGGIERRYYTREKV